MLKWNGHLSSVISSFLTYRVIFQSTPPSCITAKHLLLETQMSGALLPPKLNQHARLRYQIKPRAALLCSAVDQCSPLVKSLFHRGFKTDFIKCSISKWATHYSRKDGYSCNMSSSAKISNYSVKFNSLINRISQTDWISQVQKFMTSGHSSSFSRCLDIFAAFDEP